MTPPAIAVKLHPLEVAVRLKCLELHGAAPRNDNSEERFEFRMLERCGAHAQSGIGAVYFLGYYTDRTLRGKISVIPEIIQGDLEYSGAV